MRFRLQFEDPIDRRPDLEVELAGVPRRHDLVLLDGVMWRVGQITWPAGGPVAPFVYLFSPSELPAPDPEETVLHTDRELRRELIDAGDAEGRAAAAEARLAAVGEHLDRVRACVRDGAGPAVLLAELDGVPCP